MPPPPPVPNCQPPGFQQPGRNQLPNYAPSHLPEFSPTTLSTSQRKLVPKVSTQRPSPPPATKLSARQVQRPWTLKEWIFVEHIPEGIDNLELQGLQFKFRDRFGWVPSEGQMRSQFWYFRKGRGEMRKWLDWMQKYEEGRSAIKISEGEMVRRLKTRTLKPSW